MKINIIKPKLVFRELQDGSIFSLVNDDCEDHNFKRKYIKIPILQQFLNLNTKSTSSVNSLMLATFAPMWMDPDFEVYEYEAELILKLK